MHVDIKSVNVPYQFTLPNGHVLFKIEEATLTHKTFTGGMTSPITMVQNGAIRDAKTIIALTLLKERLNADP